MPRELDRAKWQIWRRRLLEFERGNESIAEFCRRAGVAVWTFYYWRRKVQRGAMAAASERQRTGTATLARDVRPDNRSRRSGMKPKLNFVPIEITERPRVDVHLPNGTRVTVPCHERDAIGAVIAALLTDSQEAQPC